MLPGPGQKSQLVEMLASPETFATTLIVWLIDYYGLDLLEWTLPTILMEVEDDLGVNLPEANAAKIAAAIALLTSNAFYKDLPAFLHTVNVLDGHPIPPGTFDPVEAADCAWAITEALLLAPPDFEERAGDEDEPFAPEIRYYLGRVLGDEGIMEAPDILGLALRDQPPMSLDYSDDPELMAAIQETQMARTGEIRETILTKLRSLINQLSSLPLTHGDVTEIQQKALQALQSAREEVRPG